MKRLLVVMLSLATLAAGAPAKADHGDGPELQAWVKEAKIGSDPSNGNCTFRIFAYGQEFGQHGVTQFKFRFRIFVGAISEYAPATPWLYGVRADTGWLYSNAFEDDTRNLWSSAGVIDSLAMGSDNNYTLHARVVGVRPSWWQPDLKANVRFGYCEPGIVTGIGTA